MVGLYGCRTHSPATVSTREEGNEGAYSQQPSGWTSGGCLEQPREPAHRKQNGRADGERVQTSPSRGMQAAASPRKIRISRGILRNSSPLRIVGRDSGWTFSFQDKRDSGHRLSSQTPWAKLPAHACCVAGRSWQAPRPAPLPPAELLQELLSPHCMACLS